MWLRFTFKDPPYRRADSLVASRDLHIGKAQVGHFAGEFGARHAYALDLLPYLPGTEGTVIPVSKLPPLDEPDLERALVLRADTTRDAQYLRSMPAAFISTYRIGKMLVEFQHAVYFKGSALEEPESLKSVLTSLPENSRKQIEGRLYADIFASIEGLTPVTRINFIEVSIEPLGWEDVFFTSSFVTAEEAGGEVDVPPAIGYLQLFNDLDGNSALTPKVYGERVPAFLLPRQVPETLNWLREPDFREEPAN